MSAENPAGLSRYELYRSLAAITASACGVGISFGVGYPLVSLVFEAWHQPHWVIGLAGAVPSIAILLLMPVLPRILSMLGAVPAMVLGCLISASGFLGLYFVQSVPVWIALRFVMSAGLTGGTSFMEDYTYHLSTRISTPSMMLNVVESM